MKTKSTVLKSIAVAGALTAAGTVAATTAHADAVNNAAPANAASVSTTNADQQLANLKSQQAANEAQTSSANAAKMSAATSAANGQIANLNNQIKQRQASDAAAKQSKVDQVNKEAQTATDAENNAYSSAVAKQTADNAEELKAAQAKVVTDQQKEQKKDKAASDYKKAQEQLTDEHQNNLTNSKTKYSQDVQKITNQANEGITQTQSDLIKLKDQLNKDKEKVASFNAANFFKSVMDNQKASSLEKKDAQAAYNIVTGTGTFTDAGGNTKPAPKWYKKAVHIGQQNDATSLANLKASLILYDQFVKIRKDRQLSVPKVSLANVAIAMLDSDYQTVVNGLRHPAYYGVGENLDEDTLNHAIDDWMAEESAWKEAVKQHPDLAKELGQYYVYQYYPKIYGKVGHFSNMMSPDMASYGFAVNGDVDNGYVYTAFDFGGSKDGVYSQDEYTALVNNYIASSQAAMNAIKEDQVKIDQTQATLNKLQKQQEDLVNQVKDEYNTAVQKENQSFNGKLSSLKTAYDQRVKSINELPTSTVQLEKQLQAKLDALKAQHENKLQTIQDSIKEKLAKIQAGTNDSEIGKLRVKINEIKDNLAKQQKKLDDQFAALKAKDEADYNALEQKLKNSSSEAAKGHNDHYNTGDGHEVVLPGSDSNQPSSSASTPASSASSSANSAASSANTPASSASSDVTPAASSANTPASSATSAASSAADNSAASSEATAPAAPASDNQTVAGNVTSTAADEAVKVSYPVDNAAQAAVSAPVATTPMTREEVKKQNEAKLPQTGNENGIVAMALGTMLAMFGLGVAAKKRY